MNVKYCGGTAEVVDESGNTFYIIRPMLQKLEKIAADPGKPYGQWVFGSLTEDVHMRAMEKHGVLTYEPEAPVQMLAGPRVYLTEFGRLVLVEVRRLHAEEVRPKTYGPNDPNI